MNEWCEILITAGDDEKSYAVLVGVTDYATMNDLKYTVHISDFVLMEDLNRPKADAYFEAAQKLRRSKKYGEAKVQIDLALKLYPQEKGIIEDYIKLTGSGDASIPAGRRVNISTSSELHDALKNEDNAVLVLAPGTYNLSESYWISGKNLSIRSRLGENQLRERRVLAFLEW